MKYIKSYTEQSNFCNESIKDFLKPKSEEEIENVLKNLTPNQKILRGCEENYLWLVKRGIEEGGNPSFAQNICIWNAVIDQNAELIKLLLSDDRVLIDAIKSRDIDHFYEVAYALIKDREWLTHISDKIDELSKNK